MAKEFGITFEAQGYIHQTIEILDESYAPEDIVKGLKEGTMATTAQEGGEIIALTKGFDDKGEFPVVAKVSYVDSELEYMEFELKDEDEDED
jgi:hypothetical protein